jgi:glycosyltransferase involved in cell wall biosynthesis
MIRVLHVVARLHGGGVERFLLNHYRHMKRDAIRFDFIVHGQERGALEDAFEELGSTIYHVDTRRASLRANIAGMTRVIRHGHYDAIHAHLQHKSIIPLWVAKRAGIKVRIVHSHLAFMDHAPIKQYVTYMCRGALMRLSTHLWSCGAQAAVSLFGVAVGSGRTVEIIPNAIDLDEFDYSDNKRNKYRDIMSLDGCFVLGHVGRFCAQKNQSFLLSVFSELRKKIPEARLLIIGHGEDERQLRALAEELGVHRYTHFAGLRRDVGSCMQAMDAFILPSRYEGLGVTLVEAQAAGLMCYASTGVPVDAGLTDLAHFIELSKGPCYWADKIAKEAGSRSRIGYRKKLQSLGYHAPESAKLLQSRYEAACLI